MALVYDTDNFIIPNESETSGVFKTPEVSYQNIPDKNMRYIFPFQISKITILIWNLRVRRESVGDSSRSSCLNQLFFTGKFMTIRSCIRSIKWIQFCWASGC
jgi:hypothetical protein